MGTDKFRFIRSDGSRPMMTVGGDIGAYQKCLIRFKDAWELHGEDHAVADPAELKYEEVSMTILQQVQTAYLRGSWPRREPRLIAQN